MKDTLEDTGAGTKTALTTISNNVKSAGEGQKSSLTMLLSALTSLDTNNEASLDAIEHSIGDTKDALQTIATQTLRRSSHHGFRNYDNITTAPVYEFIDESTVNLEPVQSNNQQQGSNTNVTATSNDQNNPTTGGSNCGSGLLSSIGCNIKLTLGRKKRQQEHLGKKRRKLLPLSQTTKLKSRDNR